MPAKQQDLYIIVCGDMHASMGPFVSAAQALAIAHKMNEKSTCVFMPVPFLFGPNVIHHQVDETVEEDRPYGGQYL
jgi:hypothetical protein